MSSAEDDDELELGAGEDDAVEDLGSDAEAIDVAEFPEDQEDGPVAKRSKPDAAAAASVEDVANIEARRQVREQLESDVEIFLRKGGKIEAIADDVRADPPKKPESKYGTRSI